VRRVLTFAFVLATASCAPPACSETSERAARQDIKLLVEDEGPLAEAARARLVARGGQAIAVIETGLYAANPPARLRIVRTLAEIGARETLPILEHLAAHDPDPGVRAAAQRAKEQAISAHP